MQWGDELFLVLYAMLALWVALTVIAVTERWLRESLKNALTEVHMHQQPSSNEWSSSSSSSSSSVRAVQRYELKRVAVEMMQSFCVWLSGKTVNDSITRIVGEFGTHHPFVFAGSTTLASVMIPVLLDPGSVPTRERW